VDYVVHQQVMHEAPIIRTNELNHEDQEEHKDPKDLGQRIRDLRDLRGCDLVCTPGQEREGECPARPVEMEWVG
jgi:hypothetical protein